MLTLLKTCFVPYAVRPLTQADLPDMLTLCRGNPLYYRHMGFDPSLENLARDLTALPPGKAPADKTFAGLYEPQTGRLAALLDLIAGYPAPGAVYIGWFILDRSLQGRGEGSALIRRLLAGLAAQGVRSVHLGVIKSNPQALHFWQKNGFCPAADRAGEAGSPVLSLVCPLDGAVKPV